MEGTFNKCAAVSAIMNTMLCSGINFMPASFRNSGIPAAIGILTGVACLKTFSIYVLFRCSSKFIGQLSYANIGKKYSKKLKTAIDLVILCASFLTALGFQKYINTLVFAAVKDYFPNMTENFGFLLSNLLLLCFTVPLNALAMIKNFGNLKILSYMSVFCVASLIVVLGFFNLWIPEYINSTDRIIDNTRSFSFSLSYFILAMSVQINIPQVFAEIKDKSKTNLLKIAAYASIFGLAVYEFAGYLGYRLIGDYIGNNDIIINFLDTKSDIHRYLLSIGSQLGYLLKFQGLCAILILIVGFPMQLGPSTRYFKQVFTTENPDSFKFHALIVLNLMMMLTIINLIQNIPLNLIYGLLGPSAVGFISFLFPFIFYILSKKDTKENTNMKYLKLIASYIVCALSIIYCFYGCSIALINNFSSDEQLTQENYKINSTTF